MPHFLNPRMIWLLSVAWAALVVGQETTGELEPVPDPQAADLEKIETAIAAYVTAFNAKDVETLVSLWSPKGVYVSRTSGERLTGREALKEEFTAILSVEDAPTLSVNTESLEFISPSVALERGSAVVSGKDFSEETSYQVVYVQHDGTWLIDRVSEDVVDSKPSNYEHLKGLEFMVGQWFNEGDQNAIEIDCQWTSNQNYLSRKYKILSEGEIESSGLQIIGWDAKSQQICSWLFDSDGGFVKGEWSQRDDTWVIQSVATLVDGSSGSSTSVMGMTDTGEISWRQFNRVLDGRLLPNTEEIILQRR